ncbi:MAG: glutamine synthetase [Bacillota bacterium]|nr:glutamine synthetase [Bacillota bacterium]
MSKDLVYFIKPEQQTEGFLKDLLTTHTEIKFVSLVGIDYSGNDTDEKIPVEVLLEDISGFLNGAVQTDGSSVVLPGIATLNNAKVDMPADKTVNWFVDYNYENLDEETGKPVGTLRIPSFFIHEGKAIDSRYILKNSIETFKSDFLALLAKHPAVLADYGITVDDIADVVATSATELEFWVRTPDAVPDVPELSPSQVLQEQYWARTKGSVRTALEETLVLLGEYGFEPEMGHKEVGGRSAKLDEFGNLVDVCEQIEIDWKYSNALQAADNELFVRNIVKETFRRYGLDVTFEAKPIEGVAGSGEHTHVGIALKLKNGKRINLFTATKNHFLSVFGYASVMGVLNNYEVVNPFVSATTDSLRRLKPGFEAPICIVTSLGHSVEVPSRNRSVLIGLVRDLNSPLATRFELRAPNPHSNTYLVLSALYLAILDGVKYALNNNKTEDDLLAELSKKPGEDADYLAKDRAYRTEENIFEDFSEEERIALFGKAPATVYENFLGFEKYPEKAAILKVNDVLTDKIIESFKEGLTLRWTVEITTRIERNYSAEIRSYKKLHDAEHAADIDIANWNTVSALRKYIAKDTFEKKCLFTQVNEAVAAEDFAKVSDLYVELDNKLQALRAAYKAYKNNLLDI